MHDRYFVTVPYVPDSSFTVFNIFPYYFSDCIIYVSSRLSAISTLILNPFSIFFILDIVFFSSEISI